MSSSNKKRQLGQYFTQGNPFLFKPFKQWLDSFWHPDMPILEPFSGANHLVGLMAEAGFTAQWSCFDVHPPVSQAQGFAIQSQDTLKNFPSGFTVAITNPPYLARFSATRRKMPYPDTPYSDIYLLALSRLLEKVPFVAAIVPESFMASGLFRERLQSVIHLKGRMFTDTEHPVCLALFIPSTQKASLDFEVFSGDRFLGSYHTLTALLPVPSDTRPWRFNDPLGSLGLLAIDSRKEEGIRFTAGASIDPCVVKNGSRLITRISGCPAGFEKAVIDKANQLLTDYRQATDDILLPAFKCLRKDGAYRRRLYFGPARQLLDVAWSHVGRLSLKNTPLA